MTNSGPGWDTPGYPEQPGYLSAQPVPDNEQQTPGYQQPPAQQPPAPGYQQPVAGAPQQPAPGFPPQPTQPLPQQPVQPPYEANPYAQPGQYGQPGPQNQPFAAPGQYAPQPPGGYPPGGYPPAGGYPGGGGYPPVPPPQSHTLRNVLIGLGALVVIGGGTAGAIVATSSGSKHHNAQSTNGPTSSSSTGATSSNPTTNPTSGLPSFPSSDNPSSDNPSSDNPSSAGPAAGAPSVSDSRAVAERYLKDINAHNESDAQTLICQEALPSWQQNKDATNGDFTIHVDSATFTGSASGDQPDSTNVSYNVAVTSNSVPSQHGSSSLTFTMINENGVKICGESNDPGSSSSPSN